MNSGCGAPDCRPEESTVRFAVPETAPEAHLFDSARFPWTQGMAFHEMIGNNTYGHFDEHMPDLRTWLEG